MFDTERPSPSPVSRGLSIIEILDRSFRIYRQNFFPFLFLAIIVEIPLAVISTVLVEPQSVALQNAMTKMGVQPNQTTISPDQAQAIIGPLLSSLAGVFAILIIVTIISTILQQIVVTGSFVYITSENHLGRTATLSDGLKAVSTRFQPMLGGLIIFYAAILAASIAMVFALCLCGLGFGIIGYATLAGSSLLIPVLLLERGTVSTSLGRAWMLGKSRIWAILAITALISILGGIVSFVISVLLDRTLVSNPANVNLGVTIVTTILATLPSVLLAPILPIAYTEIYFDARVRLEGLDIALKSVNLPAPAVKDVPTPVSGGRFLANEDYLNIALFAVGGLVLVLVYYFVVLSLFGSQFGR